MQGSRGCLSERQGGDAVLRQIELAKVTQRSPLLRGELKQFIPPIDYEACAATNRQIQERRAQQEYSNAMELTGGLARNVSLGLRQRECDGILTELDRGKIVVLNMPGGFGKSPMMDGIRRRYGGGFVDSYDCFDITALARKLSVCQESIDGGPIFCWDEFSNLDDGQIVEVAKAYHDKGKAVILAVRPFGYLKSPLQKAFKSDDSFVEYSAGALSRDDERRIVEGMGLERELGERLMEVAGGHPAMYRTVFMNTIDNDEIEKSVKGIEDLRDKGWSEYIPFSLPIKQYKANDSYYRWYRGTLPAVEMVLNGRADELTPQQRQLALGCGMALEREGRLYVPPCVQVMLNKQELDEGMYRKPGGQGRHDGGYRPHRAQICDADTSAELRKVSRMYHDDNGRLIDPKSLRFVD
jgi:hypothetical protein